MPARRIVILLALPIGLILAAASALTELVTLRMGLLPSQEGAMLLVLLAAFALTVKRAGDRASGHERPLRGAAIACVGLASWLFAFEFLLPLIAESCAGLPGSLRTLLAAGLLVAGSCAAGWCVPHFGRYIVSCNPTSTRSSSALFALLLLGATVAVVLTPDLVVELGYIMLARILGIASLVVALTLLLLDKPLEHGNAPPPGTKLGVEGDGNAPAPIALLLGVLLGGAAITWTALAEPFAGGSTPARGLVTTLLLVGLTLGTGLAGLVAARLPRPDLRGLLAVTIGACLVLASLPITGDLGLAMVQANGSGSSSLGALARALGMAVVPTGIAAGFGLVLAVRARAEWTGRVTRSIGQLLALTATGGIVGAGLVRLLILPRTSPGYALLSVAGLALVATAMLALRTRGRARPVAALLTLLPLVALLWPAVTQAWLATAPTAEDTIAAALPIPKGTRLSAREELPLYGEVFGGVPRTHNAAGDELDPARGFGGPVEYMATADGSLVLSIRGRELGRLGAEGDPDASEVEVALGLVPALLSERPERALVLGAGGGMATEALLGARLARIDVVTAEPAALQAASAYRGVEKTFLDDPRTTLHLATPRGFLAAGSATTKRPPYDIIVVGAPFEPAMITNEGLRAVRAELIEGGLVALHIPLQHLDELGLRRVLGTIRQAFPAVWVFRFRDDLIVIGAAQPPALRWSRFRTLLTAPAPSALIASRAGLGSAGRVFGHLALDTEGVDGLVPVDDAGLTDTHPWLGRRIEASRRAPRRVPGLDPVLNGGFPPDVAAMISDATQRDRWVSEAVSAWLEKDTLVATVWDSQVPYGVTPRGWYTRARVALGRGDAERAARFLDLAIKQATDDKAPLVALQLTAWARAAVGGSRAHDVVTRRIVRALGDYPDDGRVLAAAAGARRILGQQEAARAAFGAAMAARTPPAPAGTGIQFARLLLSDAEPPQEKIRELMEADPALNGDADALDLYLDVLPPREYATRAPDLELLMDALRRDEAARLTGGIRRHIARGEFESAAGPAARVTELQGEQARAWERRGLIDLGRAAGQAQPAAARVLQDAARNALQRGIGVSLDPDGARARAVMIAGWYGVDLGDPAQ